MDAVLVTLGDLIGDYSHIQVTTKSFSIRGLQVKAFHYTVPNTDEKQDFANTSNNAAVKPTIVAIHGGPGFPHNYLLPLILACNFGLSVIFYDQAGCGESTFVEDPTKDASWLLEIDYYTNELQEIITGFNLSNFYLFGSSWGSMIVQEYAIMRPAGLRGIILDGALCDAQLYIRTQWRDRLSQMTTFTQALLKKLDEKKISHLLCIMNYPQN
eukprot:gene10614-14255_t